VRPTLAPEAALAKGSLCYANLRCNSDTDTPLVILQTSAHCEIYFCAFFVQMNFVDDIFAFLTVYVMYLPRCSMTFLPSSLFTLCICLAAEVQSIIDYVCAECPRLDR